MDVLERRAREEDARRRAEGIYSGQEKINQVAFHGHHDDKMTVTHPDAPVKKTYRACNVLACESKSNWFSSLLCRLPRQKSWLRTKRGGKPKTKQTPLPQTNVRFSPRQFEAPLGCTRTRIARIRRNCKCFLVSLTGCVAFAVLIGCA